MAHCLLGLGSNLGDRSAALNEAVAQLRRHPAIAVLAVSDWRETPPAGGPPGQPPYLNGAALLETALPPAAVLELTQAAEAAAGRRPGERWGPRPLDVDLLLYDELVVQTPQLRLPHPRMAWRRFVLEPAAAIAGAMRHPTIGWTLDRLREHLATTPPYVAVAGAIAAGKSRLAERVATLAAARLLAEPVDGARLAAFYRDPPARAWELELGLLEQRLRQLDRDADAWRGAVPWTVGDFWFDQSAAFARVWLPAGQQAEYGRHWAAVRQRVVRPRLLVVLDAPADELAARVRRRGRDGEASLSAAQLQRLRLSILAQAGEPDVGPVLWLGDADPEAAAAEVAAAIEAMR